VAGEFFENYIMLFKAYAALKKRMIEDRDLLSGDR